MYISPSYLLPAQAVRYGLGTQPTRANVIVPWNRVLVATYAPLADAFVPVTQNSSGLIFSDDFNRANSSTIGAGWVEHTGDWVVEGNRLHVHSNSAARSRTIEYDQVDRGEMFLQIGDVDIPSLVSSSEGAGPIMRFDGAGSASWDGYLFWFGDTGALRIYEYTSGSQTGPLDSSAGNPGKTDVPFQSYVADGVQEGWANGETASATDTTHDATTRDVALVADTSSGLTGQHFFDDVLICTSKNITVDGLASGDKAKVLNSSDTVVAEATESGGTATIDASRFGGATELCPLAGWPKLIITDSSDVELGHTFASDVVYPGGDYSF
jgi:hypothetical protein